jgi:hypothetical protein
MLDVFTSIAWAESIKQVRIQFSVHGGFASLPGLRRPVTLDLDTLPAAPADDLRHLVDAAGFFDLPAEIEPPAGAADFREYTITVEDDQRSHTVKIPETVSSPALRALIAKLDSSRGLGHT